MQYTCRHRQTAEERKEKNITNMNTSVECSDYSMEGNC